MNYKRGSMYKALALIPSSRARENLILLAFGTLEPVLPAIKMLYLSGVKSYLIGHSARSDPLAIPPNLEGTISRIIQPHRQCRLDGRLLLNRGHQSFLWTWIKTVSL